MKDKLKDKYVPASYYDHLLDNWHWFIQDTKSAKDCVAQFDEFLIRCNMLGTESDTQVFRFRAQLKKTWELNFWLVKSQSLRLMS